MKDALGKDVQIGDAVVYFYTKTGIRVFKQGIVTREDEGKECKMRYDKTGKESAWIMPHNLILLKP